MAGDARKNVRKVESEGSCDASGIYRVADRTSRVASLPEHEAMSERRMKRKQHELGVKTLVEEPTDELSVLLSEKRDGAVRHDESFFMPKNPLPDPELHALVKSMQSYYEKNEKERNENRVDSSILALSELNSTWSRPPSSTKTFPWIKTVSFVAAALVVAFAGAVGGWYAAQKATHIITAESAPADSPSADAFASSVSQPSPMKLNTTAAPSIRQTSEPKVGVAPIKSVGISRTAKQTVVADKIKNHQSKTVRARVSVRAPGSVSGASEPTRSANAVISPEPNREAVETAISPHESSGFEPTIARSSGSEDGIYKPIASENSTLSRTIEATETTEVAETIAAGNTVVSPPIPETLSREQVRDGFKSMYQQIIQCAAGKHGVAKIKATLAGSGRVVFALVEGDFNGSAEGSCMARAVRKTTFPEFAKSKLTVEFPYVL